MQIHDILIAFILFKNQHGVYRVSQYSSLCKYQVSIATLQVASTKGTLTPIHSVEYLPTQHLTELGVREGKAFNVARKEVVQTACKQENIKQPQKNFQPNLGSINTKASF